MKKAIATLLVFALAMGCMAGCSAKETAKPAAASETASVSGTEKLKIAGNPDDVYYMVTFQSGIEFWRSCREGFEAAAKAFGAQAVYTGAEAYDLTSSLAVFEQVAALKPAGIAVTCMSADAYASYIDDAVANGVNVVTFNADSPKSSRYSLVGPDNYSGGQAGAKALAEALGHKGQVGVLSVTGQSNHEDRARGFIDYITENEPDMEVVQVGNSESKEEIATSVASGIMQAYPDVAGFFCTASAATVGVATAIVESGKEIKLVGFDQNEAILDKIDEGVITASVSQNNWQMGYWAFVELYLLRNDCLKEGWKESGFAPLPPHLNTDFSIITKENTSAYRTSK